MKFWKILAIPVLTVSLLSGCGVRGDFPPEQTGTSTEQTDSTISSGTPDAEKPSGENAADPSLHEGMAHSLLTNEWLPEEEARLRPLAVMIPNEIHAIPHYSLSQASVIYEARVEGSMTRMMALFENWQDLKKIGNIRSLRSYFAYWAFEWDSVIVHYGGPYFIYDLLAQEYTENIDGMYENTPFFRTVDRESPHNAYTSGNLLKSAMEKKGYSLEYRGLTDDSHFLFAPEENPNTLTQYGSAACNATYIDMTAAYPLTRCYFEYNDVDGLYYRSQYLSGGTDGPHLDAATGEQLSFSNIIVQHVKQEDIGNGYLAMQCHDTTRDGWFYTQGRGIHVTWEKTSDYGATRYYDDDGYQITLNTGKTMILIIRDTDTFTCR